MFNDSGYYMSGMHGSWWLFWVLFIGVLVFVSVILFVRLGRSNEERKLLGETPQDILQQRLARGEITAEEYESHKVLLDRDSRA